MESRAPGRVRRVDRDLSALGSVTQAVLDGDNLEQILARIAHEARILVDAVTGVVVTVAGRPELMAPYSKRSYSSLCAARSTGCTVWMRAPASYRASTACHSTSPTSASTGQAGSSSQMPIR